MLGTTLGLLWDSTGIACPAPEMLWSFSWNATLGLIRTAQLGEITDPFSTYVSNASKRGIVSGPIYAYPADHADDGSSHAICGEDRLGGGAVVTPLQLLYGL